MSNELNPDRPLIVGPEKPESPYPHSVAGKVVSGFGRGSKELGIPTGRFLISVCPPPQLLTLGLNPLFFYPRTHTLKTNVTIIANLSEEALEAMCTEFTTGVYYGWVQIAEKGSEVYPMVMSLGWNPYYKNEKRSAEVHIIHEFKDDFYGIDIRVIVLGYVRPEQNYPSLDALIRDIRTDVEVAKTSLQRPAYLDFKQHELFTKQ
ncbi:hypothetical protein BDB00DRAFT_755662 [Zychaea mexicana]|uniref:uncharacterized protein n=1 Tax=Zychaea mexicana TaxID=64656 RepID=UPI0022FEBF4D|nr:uncharacterized protein BDB00DRAFT_755662 [Zychaea mexicana]KAI9498004.1 hypothetical protein BDB00DRAFT_755662 [Zychaea mexicana]